MEAEALEFPSRPANGEPFHAMARACHRLVQGLAHALPAADGAPARGGSLQVGDPRPRKAAPGGGQHGKRPGTRHQRMGNSSELHIKMGETSPEWGDLLA